MNGKVDAKAFLRAIDEFLAEGSANIGSGQGLPIMLDGGDGKDSERLPPGFNTDNRLFGFERLQHRLPTTGDVVAKNFGGVNAVEHQRRGRLESDQRYSLRRQRLHRAIKQRCQTLPIALAMALATGGNAPMT